MVACEGPVSEAARLVDETLALLDAPLVSAATERIRREQA
jgi:hypothetical protein